MNRQKKLKQLFTAKKKKANAKLAPVKKSTYVSKADRLKLAETSEESIVCAQGPASAIEP